MEYENYNSNILDIVACSFLIRTFNLAWIKNISQIAFFKVGFAPKRFNIALVLTLVEM